MNTSEPRTDAAIIDAYERAYERAVAARLFCYRLDACTYEVPSVSQPGRMHRVTRSGARWHDWHCDCHGGQQLACMHRAVAVYAHKYHTGAAPATRQQKGAHTSHVA